MGPPGPAGSLTGTAGGDLTGTYPNPVLRAGAVAGGSGGEVADNTLTNADLAGGAQFTGATAGGGLTGTYPSPFIAPNAVSSTHIVNGTVLQEDLAPDAFGARAYGRVAADGSLSRFKNVDTISHPTTGLYCIDLVDSIDPAFAVLIVSPDFTGNSTGGAGNHSVVEWSSSGQSGIANCPAGTFAVVTFTFTGDTTDDNDGGGDSTGDSLQPDDEPFAFVVP